MTAQAVVLKGGQVVDPAQGINGVVDVRIEGNRIAAVGAELPLDGATRVDMPGELVVCPGFIDMHVTSASPGKNTRRPSPRAPPRRWRAASWRRPACPTPIRSTTTSA